MTGILMSVMIRSNGSPPDAASSASRPFAATCTSWPSISSTPVSSFWMLSSSSTTRMRRRSRRRRRLPARPSRRADAARSPRDDRQLDGERRAAAGRALRPDPPAVLLDDAVADRQAEARALARLLRREERVEDAAQRLGAHAGAAVAERRRHGAVATPRADAQRALRRSSVGAHRLLGVDDDVQEHLLDLVRVEHRLRQRRVELQLGLDVADAQVVVAQLQHALDERVEVRRLLLRPAPARERQQVRHDLRCALGLAVDRLDLPPRRLVEVAAAAAAARSP